MKYCHICGSLIENDSVVTCPSCGRKQHSFVRPDGTVIDPYRIKQEQTKVEGSSPVIEEPTPVVVPIVEEPAPVVEVTPEPAPVIEEPAHVEEPEPVVDDPKPVPAPIVEKPKKKGLIIGIAAGIAGVIALGAIGAIVIPPLLKGGDTPGNVSRPNGGGDAGGVMKSDPIGTWAYSEESNLFYSFEENNVAKYWEVRDGQTYFLYYGTWKREDAKLTAHYDFYFNSGVSSVTYGDTQTFTIGKNYITGDDNGIKYYRLDKTSPVVDPICGSYDDTGSRSQAAGKTGYFVMLGFKGDAYYRWFRDGERQAFYRGTWEWTSKNTIRCLFNERLKDGSYQSTGVLDYTYTVVDDHLVNDVLGTYYRSDPKNF